jgi:hypothetical protein
LDRIGRIYKISPRLGRGKGHFMRAESSEIEIRFVSARDKITNSFLTGLAKFTRFLWVGMVPPGTKNL